MGVIGVVGLPGSGKSEAAAVARDLGIPVVTMGEVIREACAERGLDPATHHGEVARALRNEDGPAAIADASVPMVSDALSAYDTVLVDGIRSDAEVQRFREAFGADFTLVRVEAPFDVRAERIDERGRDDPDAESLADRDDRELGFGMEEAMEQADVVVENTDSLEAFHDRVRALLTDGSDP